MNDQKIALAIETLMADSLEKKLSHQDEVQVIIRRNQTVICDKTFVAEDWFGQIDLKEKD
ncbi:hypothetical protein [Psychrobacter sp. I-STPA10]|uniref:hypothetical protein n=1 Tax=Psychrobacter sp. I-STPA10 TaxID=2585769 RepID=UPI001E3F769F|nr:hypothetical protein [Psychrobacter sp. I-STPA10]